MAVVEVSTYVVKPQDVPRAVQAMVADYERYLKTIDLDGPVEVSGRIYTAPGGRIIYVSEWDCLADCEQAWAAFEADPATAPLRGLMDQLMLPGGSREFWNLELDVTPAR